MSAKDEIDALIDRTGVQYEATDSPIKRAEFLGKAALAGALRLAERIDEVSESLDSLNKKMVEIQKDLGNLRRQVKKPSKTITKSHK